jgi:hypothetical protein
MPGSVVAMSDTTQRVRLLVGFTSVALGKEQPVNGPPKFATNVFLVTSTSALLVVG